jgi:hypothetical protein
MSNVRRLEGDREPANADLSFTSAAALQKASRSVFVASLAAPAKGAIRFIACSPFPKLGSSSRSVCGLRFAQFEWSDRGRRFAPLE